MSQCDKLRCPVNSMNVYRMLGWVLTRAQTVLITHVVFVPQQLSNVCKDATNTAEKRRLRFKKGEGVTHDPTHEVAKQSSAPF